MNTTLKHLLSVAIIACAITGAFAQNAGDLRTVNGQLYDVTKSVLWQTIPPQTSFGSKPFVAGRSVKEMKTYAASVLQVFTNSVLVKVTVRSGEGFAVSKTDDDWQGRLILIKNHPRQNAFTTGDKFTADRFFPVGVQTFNTKAGGSYSVKVYDYGFPNVPEKASLKAPTR